MPLIDTTTPVTSGFLVVPAVWGRSDNASLAVTRNAAGDWSLNRTATGAETYNITVPLLPDLFETTSGKGVRIDGIKISHQILGVALTSATFQGINLVQYANNVANSVATYGGTATVTMPTAVQANPYLTAVSLSAPAFQNLIDTQIVVDFQIVMANTGQYKFQGISVLYSVALY